MDFNKLKEPFPKDKISWRVGSVSKDKTKAMVLAYLDSRDVMQRLDDVCGIGGWQNTHPHANGKTSCRIGIKNGDEWVWKENGAGDSAVEAEKGAFSDAFKRSAVLWGIGRYLYDVPTVWVDIDEYKQIKNLKDPRLAKALEAAEKGIKLENEPEPEARAFAQSEMEIMRKALNEALTLEAVLEVQKKLTAAKPRMSKDQQTEIGAELKRKLDFYAMAPSEAV